MTKKIIAITGGTSGVGKSLAYKLAEKGHELVIFARNETKAGETVSKIIRRTGNGGVSYLVCDLSEPSSVYAAAGEFKNKFTRLDVLVNNAGVSYPKPLFNSEGIEKTFAANHLGHFLLTYLLMNLLEGSAPSRILNVTSQAHIKINFTNLNAEKFYKQLTAYGYSKTANILFTFGLAGRLEGKGVSVNCVHPGVVRTPIYDSVPFPARMLIRAMSMFFISPEKSADRIMPLILSEKYGNINGKYFINLKESVPKEGTCGRNDGIRLWELSNGLLKINF